ncbi:MAG: hypothetical protein OHK0022_18340 [Roseiflexaceae bacterium]
MSDQPQATAQEQATTSKPTTPSDTALLEALCALQDEAVQHAPLTTQNAPLALLAEWLNGLTSDGLVLWRQGANWSWCWQGTGLVAEMDRLGLGDAVADAVAARYGRIHA